jgi:hypothetical protein
MSHFLTYTFRPICSLLDLLTCPCTAKLLFFSLALQPKFGPWPTSMKLSVSFRFLDLRQSVGLLRRVISSSQVLYLYTNTEKLTHTHTQILNIHALSGIRTHDPGFRSSEDSACLRPLGYRDRRKITIRLS